MPYRRKRRVAKRSNVRRYRRKQGRGVKSHPQQIQSASFVPPSRMVRFTDCRQFVVEDSEGLINSYCPSKSFTCNDPTQTFRTTYDNGDWSACSLGAKGAAVPAIANWVSKADGTNGGVYRQASAVSAKIKITVTPLARDGSADSYQDCAQVLLQRSTGIGNAWHDKAVSATHNGEVLKQLPQCKSAMVYLNHGGTPRGCTISDSYSFAKTNAIRPSVNIFTQDGMVTGERDSWQFAILPGYSAKYGNVTGGTRMPDMRVEIQISYIVALTEVATDASYLNEGIDLGEAAGFVGANVVAMAGAAGPLLFAT